MHRRKYLVLLAFILLVTLPGLSAGTNLVTNPGFETGYFTTWSTALNSPNTYVGTNPHSGTYAASFGSTLGYNDWVGQYLNLTPGQQYNFSFWLANNAGDRRDNQFQAYDAANYYTNGLLPDLNLYNAPDQSYIKYSYVFTALGYGNDWIDFGGYNSPSFFYLDDVSVTAVPEPSCLLLLGSGLIGLAGYGRRKFFKK